MPVSAFKIQLIWIRYTLPPETGALQGGRALHPPNLNKTLLEYAKIRPSLPPSIGLIFVKFL